MFVISAQINVDIKCAHARTPALARVCCSVAVAPVSRGVTWRGGGGVAFNGGSPVLRYVLYVCAVYTGLVVFHASEW